MYVPRDTLCAYIYKHVIASPPKYFSLLCYSTFSTLLQGVAPRFPYVKNEGMLPLC